MSEETVRYVTHPEIVCVCYEQPHDDDCPASLNKSGLRLVRVWDSERSTSVMAEEVQAEVTKLPPVDPEVGWRSWVT